MGEGRLTKGKDIKREIGNERREKGRVIKIQTVYSRKERDVRARCKVKWKEKKKREEAQDSSPLDPSER